MLVRELYSKIMYGLIDEQEHLGLTKQQLIVIKLIAHKKKMTISEICKEMSLSKGTVSGIIQRLEKMGYIHKFKNTNDLRSTYVIFSEQGLEFSRKFKENINNSFTKIFKNLSTYELKNLNKSLIKILDEIEER
ncbi:MarR family winged helix-turn-helix transcriptional regulator [Clostridium tarantellae]|uniref:MarR family transcriptional regulator n=1 Tax=Clostridium tarantellae TaxID=39493 RepID=A0A6I1MLR1_9CLOT|nr:MarR family transcriptional regulator [Clostridium tarantellae]MPQ43172.1 MarR family transcriptional regulator [Clostridium tarantellae]